MGWQFAGFFAQADRSILEAALRTWPGCVGRLITEPFQGIGVAVPEHALTYTYGPSDEEREHARELASALELELEAWSRAYPTMPFVFLRAACVGGPCLYAGYVCQDGVVRLRASDRERGGAALPRLVRALGVELGDPPDFAPFTRGFFDHARGPNGAPANDA
jgi:hypothetical protein